MSSFTLGELANAKDVSSETLRRYLKKIGFKKTSIGRNYSETEAWEITQELDFTLPGLNGQNVSIADRLAQKRTKPSKTAKDSD